MNELALAKRGLPENYINHLPHPSSISPLPLSIILRSFQVPIYMIPRSQEERGVRIYHLSGCVALYIIKILEIGYYAAHNTMCFFIYH